MRIKLGFGHVETLCRQIPERQLVFPICRAEKMLPRCSETANVAAKQIMLDKVEVTFQQQFR